VAHQLDELRLHHERVRGGALLFDDALEAPCVEAVHEHERAPEYSNGCITMGAVEYSAPSTRIERRRSSCQAYAEAEVLPRAGVQHALCTPVVPELC